MTFQHFVVLLSPKDVQHSLNSNEAKEEPFLLEMFPGTLSDKCAPSLHDYSTNVEHLLEKAV